MEKSKFRLGDKIFVLENHKIKEIEVKSIVSNARGYLYSGSDAETCLFPCYPEIHCFPSKNALISYLTDDSRE